MKTNILSAQVYYNQMQNTLRQYTMPIVKHSLLVQVEWLIGDAVWDGVGRISTFGFRKIIRNLNKIYD